MDVQPTTDSDKKTRKQSQSKIVYLYGLYDAYKKKIKELEENKAIAIKLLEEYKIQLFIMKRNFGDYHLDFKEEEGLYTFSDSTTFDIRTQEFVFQGELDTIPLR